MIDKSENNSAVAVYESHSEAEAGLKELQRCGFDMKRLSIVGKDYHTEEQVIGYYNAGDRMKRWGTAGAFWGGIWGLLVGSAFFAIPGIGPDEDVERLLPFLTPEQRDVIVYRFYAGLSARETANAMGRHEAAVRALQFRAIAAMRRQLARTASGRPVLQRGAVEP